MPIRVFVLFAALARAAVADSLSDVCAPVLLSPAARGSVERTFDSCQSEARRQRALVENIARQGVPESQQAALGRQNNPCEAVAGGAIRNKCNQTYAKAMSRMSESLEEALEALRAQPPAAPAAEPPRVEPRYENAEYDD